MPGLRLVLLVLLVLPTAGIVAVAGCGSTTPYRLETLDPAAEPYAAGSPEDAADRARFECQAVTVDARFLKVRASDLPPFTSLRPVAAGSETETGAVYAVVRADEPWLASNEDREVLSAPRVTVFDGRSGTALVLWRHAYIAGLTREEDGYGPVIATFASGVTLEVRPSLAADGSLVVLGLRHEVAARDEDRDLRLRVERGEELGPDATALDVEVPALSRTVLEGRFALRAGESLLFVQSGPGPGDEALVTVVTWSRPKA